MKSWFAKFRISNALNAGTLPPSLRRKIDASDELRHYAADQAALGEALKRTAPRPPALPELHSSILRAIRAADKSNSPRVSGIGWRWLAPAALTALVLLGIFVLLHRPPPPTQIVNISPVPQIESEKELVQLIPPVTAPLSDEFARLNTDLRRTEQFLLAKLPSNESVEETLNR
jgi:hypothetical protein